MRQRPGGIRAREVVAQIDLSINVAEHSPPESRRARNRGLDALTAGRRAKIFIDDDEIPSPGWLSALLT